MDMSCCHIDAVTPAVGEVGTPPVGINKRCERMINGRLCHLGQRMSCRAQKDASVLFSLFCSSSYNTVLAGTEFVNGCICFLLLRRTVQFPSNDGTPIVLNKTTVFRASSDPDGSFAFALFDSLLIYGIKPLATAVARWGFRVPPEEQC